MREESVSVTSSEACGGRTIRSWGACHCRARLRRLLLSLGLYAPGPGVASTRRPRPLLGPLKLCPGCAVADPCGRYSPGPGVSVFPVLRRDADELNAAKRAQAALRLRLRRNARPF